VHTKTSGEKIPTTYKGLGGTKKDTGKTRRKQELSAEAKGDFSAENDLERFLSLLR